jgi:Ni,Fe-hydrogenase I cytochrome b subunit
VIWALLTILVAILLIRCSLKFLAMKDATSMILPIVWCNDFQVLIEGRSLESKHYLFLCHFNRLFSSPNLPDQNVAMMRSTHFESRLLLDEPWKYITSS